MRILFISANPHWEARLDLAEELRLLMRAIKGRDVELMLLPAAQPAEVEVALEYERPDIVHFSGHATEEEGILLRNSEGETEELPPEKLRELLEREDGEQIKLVVLNACNTKACVDQLKDTVGAVIGTTELLADGAGKAFTKYFYRALAAGSAIRDAYEKATRSIRLAELDDVYVEALGEGGAVRPFDGVEDSDSDHVSPEALRSWETYFYLSFLDDQIKSLRRWVQRNRRSFVVLVALLSGIVFWVYWRWDVWGPILIGDEPFLSWLLTGTGGVLIPSIYSYLQEQLALTGSHQLAGLKSLRRLVETAEELSDEVRATLHRLLEQSLRGAQPR